MRSIERAAPAVSLAAVAVCSVAAAAEETEPPGAVEATGIAVDAYLYSDIVALKD